VLLRLGEREREPERLEKAVAAYREALEEITRRREVFSKRQKRPVCSGS
jgi:hypothetical protein